MGRHQGGLTECRCKAESGRRICGAVREVVRLDLALIVFGGRISQKFEMRWKNWIDRHKSLLKGSGYKAESGRGICGAVQEVVQLDLASILFAGRTSQKFEIKQNE